MRPFFGYHMPSFTFAGVPDANLFDRVVELARAAETAGFDLVTVMDHFYQIGPVGSEDEPMLEAYTLLGGVAARTERVMLGTMVTGVTYRNMAAFAPPRPAKPPAPPPAPGSASGASRDACGSSESPP